MTMGVFGAGGKKHCLFKTREEEDAAVARSPLKVALDLFALADRVGGVIKSVDENGNPLDGTSLPNCCFPDCGCPEARLCMADSGANDGSFAYNLPKRRPA